MSHMHANPEIFSANGVGWGKGELLLARGWGLRPYFLVTSLCELKKVLNFPGGPNPLDPLQIPA